MKKIIRIINKICYNWLEKYGKPRYRVTDWKSGNWNVDEYYKE